MTLAKLMIGLIALIHLGILYLEMFAWNTLGPQVFKSLAPELFGPTTNIAANQGLYNGFLAAGLIWSLIISDKVWQGRVAMFFLLCVMIAGLYGAATVSVTILLVQSVPAAIAIALLVYSRQQRI